MTLPEDHVWKTELTQGLVSPAYGYYQPAPLVHCAARGRLPAEIATAFLTQTSTRHDQGPTRMVRTHHPSVEAYELHQGEQLHEFFFAADRQPWSSGAWSSDAELLYCRTEREKLTHLIVIGGSSVTRQEQALLKAHRPSKFFEWRKADRMMNAEPEPFSRTPLFDELTGSTSSPETTSSYAEKH
jgi:hypothetical protein